MLEDIVRRRRAELGLSQADLAAATGVHLRQIRRYESGEQQPALDVAARMAGALGVSVDELAGRGGTLDGEWWAAWQLFGEGGEVLATRPVQLSRDGGVITLEALDTARRGASWRGELRMWPAQVLTGWYHDGAARGTMLFALSPDGRTARGRWAGVAGDGSLTGGHAALARARADAQAVIGNLAQQR